MRLKKRGKVYDFVTAPYIYETFPLIGFYAIKYVLSMQQIIVSQGIAKKIEKELNNFAKKFDKFQTEFVQTEFV